jgi:hypothetical protein
MSRYSLLQLPSELLRRLVVYLVPGEEKKVFQYNTDWRNFMMTSKIHLQDWRKASRYFDLNEKLSAFFLASRDFRELISSRILFSRLQLSLTFKEIAKGSKIDLHPISGVHKITLDGCTDITFEDPLYIDEIDLSYCEYSDLGFLEHCQLKSFEQTACNHPAGITDHVYDISRFIHLETVMCRGTTEFKGFPQLPNLKKAIFRDCNTFTTFLVLPNSPSCLSLNARTLEMLALWETFRNWSFKIARKFKIFLP